MPRNKPIASVDRIARVNEILKREIADFIEKLSLGQNGVFVSVTKVHCSATLNRAAVYLSFYGATPEQENNILKTIQRSRPLLQQTVAKHVVLKYTPVLHFVVDRNIAEGDRILDLLRQLDDGTNND